MYAIRIKSTAKSKPVTARGQVWVNDTLDGYTSKKLAARFETYQEACWQLSEKWEEIYEL